ncbi:hypothetical protein [Phaeobacter sp. S60]|uniref:hypothetical protein n=1 Tax=Phaeobacter sp. S60 TaxID=1569353 RepID=UPI001111E110|nr:hypothetical protein [Phaeobacter sp. S60]
MDVDFLFQLIAANQGGGGGPLVGSTTIVATAGPYLDWDFASTFPNAQVGDALIGVGAADRNDLGSAIYTSGSLNAQKISSESSKSPGSAFLLATWDGVNTRITSNNTIPVDSPSYYCGWVFGLFRGFNPGGVTASSINGTTGMPNPPLRSGFAANSLVLACGAIDDDAVTDVTPPVGFDLVGSRTASLTAGGTATAMLAWKISTAGAEDPGSFGGSGGDSWRAATLALPPV